jgi:hypothetical protein
MKVRGIVWMGVQTERFDEMAALFRTLFGASPSREEPGFALWSLGNGDIVELYSLGGKPDFGTAPVVGFQVSDLEAARRDIEAAGAEIVGGYGPNEDGYQTIHFRAPDGNVYEATYDPDHESRAPSS